MILLGIGVLLIGLIVMLIINIFVANTMLGMLISGAAVLLFSVLIAYDTQRIKEEFLTHGDVNNAAVCGALSLYLDFLNMFIHLMHIFGVANDD